MKMITTDNYDRYETIDEFLDDINRNLEIEFSCMGDDYFIWPDYKGTHYIMKNEDDKNILTYASADALVNNYKIGDKSLCELLSQIEVVCH